MPHEYSCSSWPAAECHKLGASDSLGLMEAACGHYSGSSLFEGLFCFPLASFPTVAGMSCFHICATCTSSAANHRATKAVLAGLYPFSLSAFPWPLPFPLDYAWAFHALLQAPIAFFFPEMLEFFPFFLHACHFHSPRSLHSSYTCSSPALAGSSFSKHNHESKLCK